MQPCDRTTHSADPELEIRTRTSCGGVPTWTAKVDHEPSSPSLYLLSANGVDVVYLRAAALSPIATYQYWLGATEMGTGVDSALQQVNVKQTTRMRGHRQ